MPVDSFIGVPMDSSGAFRGCELMPAALRGQGIVDRLSLQDLGNLQAVISDPRRDPATGVIGWDDFLAATEVVGTSIASIVAVGGRPLVSGGDCSILPGIGIALAGARPGWGLVFVDGHLDTYDGVTSRTGEAADMDLGMVLTGLPGSSHPLVDGDRVAVVGVRDRTEALDAGSLDPVRMGASVYPHDVGFDVAAVSAGLAEMTADWGGQWIHLDLDVLDAKSMPAVDYPQRGGLDPADVGAILAPIAQDPKLLGMSVTVLNPRLDPGGESARLATELLEAILVPV